MDTVIKVENLSKAYQLGQFNTGTLSSDLQRWWALKRGKEDPFLKIGETNNRATKGESNIVWSLRDINFEVKRGEALGVVGKNGAGKSTLLKLLSQITSPTTGSVKVKGRIASLLEVGTGFHPELTGRENIFLNGAILGMRKKEIERKFDEIVDFSGVERYIDTPVKRYSSGMYVRLAFGVAAHLESEILIIDEVLAVGDAEFQKKCLGKMNDVTRSEGRTVLFVSHNLAAVKELCTSGLLLEYGKVIFAGDAPETIKNYLAEPVKISSASDYLNDHKKRRGNGEVRFTEININDGELSSDPGDEIRIRFTADVIEDVPEIYFTFSVLNSFDSSPLTGAVLVELANEPVAKGSKLHYELVIPANTFRTGIFPLYLWLGRRGELASENYHYDCVDSVFNLNFSTTKTKEDLGYNPFEPSGLFNINYEIQNTMIL